MISAALHECMAAQLRSDHAQRLLGLFKSFALQPEPPVAVLNTESLEAMLNRLAQLGVCSPYQQACAALALLFGLFDWPEDNKPDSPRDWVLEGIRCALAAGVSPAVFRHLHACLAGMGPVNLPHIEWPPEVDLLNLVSDAPSQLTVPCDSNGPLDPGIQLGLHSQSSCVRRATGVQQRPPSGGAVWNVVEGLLATALPASPTVISLNPLVERLELGVESLRGFEPVQELMLLDARRLQHTVENQPLSLSAREKFGLQTVWQQQARLAEPQVRLAEPLAQYSLGLNAGWLHTELPVFELKGELQFELPFTGLNWTAACVLADTQVQLQLCAATDLSAQCSFEKSFPVGGLPVDQPVLLARQAVPLKIGHSQVLAAGKPVVNIDSSKVGEIVLTLHANICAATRQLSLHFALSHTDIHCNSHSIDPLCGIHHAQWRLLPAAQIARWELLHG